MIRYLRGVCFDRVHKEGNDLLEFVSYVRLRLRVTRFVLLLLLNVRVLEQLCCVKLKSFADINC